MSDRLRKRQRESKTEKEIDNVCDRERERQTMCVHQREIDRQTDRQTERERVIKKEIVCEKKGKLCVRKRERLCVCV